MSEKNKGRGKEGERTCTIIAALWNSKQGLKGHEITDLCADTLQRPRKSILTTKNRSLEWLEEKNFIKFNERTNRYYILAKEKKNPQFIKKLEYEFPEIQLADKVYPCVQPLTLLQSAIVGKKKIELKDSESFSFLEGVLEEPKPDSIDDLIARSKERLEGIGEAFILYLQEGRHALLDIALELRQIENLIAELRNAKRNKPTEWQRKQIGRHLRELKQRQNIFLQVLKEPIDSDDELYKELYYELIMEKDDGKK